VMYCSQENDAVPGFLSLSDIFSGVLTPNWFVPEGWLENDFPDPGNWQEIFVAPKFGIVEPSESTSTPAKDKAGNRKRMGAHNEEKKDDTAGDDPADMEDDALAMPPELERQGSRGDCK
jgi:hypothetical protein